MGYASLHSRDAAGLAPVQADLVVMRACKVSVPDHITSVQACTTTVRACIGTVRACIANMTRLRFIVITLNAEVSQNKIIRDLPVSMQKQSYQNLVI